MNRTCVFVLAVFLLCAKQCWAGIQNSKHDFSGKAWNASGEICKPCHTPHNADTNPMLKPLWNHKVSTANFKLYSSPTLVGSPEQPRGPSMQCLSCHDGTVALDSFGGNTGNAMMDKASLIGVDLSNDHPVSIKWQHQVKVNNCRVCHGKGFLLNGDVPFYDGYMECATCHDVHNGTNNPKFLRITMNQSALCMRCHQQ